MSKEEQEKMLNNLKNQYEALDNAYLMEQRRQQLMLRKRQEMRKKKMQDVAKLAEKIKDKE